MRESLGKTLSLLGVILMLISLTMPWMTLTLSRGIFELNLLDVYLSMPVFEDFQTVLALTGRSIWFLALMMISTLGLYIPCIILGVISISNANLRSLVGALGVLDSLIWIIGIEAFRIEYIISSPLFKGPSISYGVYIMILGSTLMIISSYVSSSPRLKTKASTGSH